MVQFAIFQSGNVWSLLRNGKVLVTGLSRSRALERAEAYAAEVRDSGDEVELLLQDYWGELKQRSWLNAGGATSAN